MPWFGPSLEKEAAEIRRRRGQLSASNLSALFQKTDDLLEGIAIVAAAAAQTLRMELFDVQFQGALVLARGGIAEMQTGEGKTLACTPAVAWLARERQGVHVLTVNDYLARRDAAWMRPIYETLGFTVGCVQQSMTTAERRAAYLCDITYATANEIGFDFLRDQIALSLGEQVHRSFYAAVIDEADSILIDEARIPMVLAGGELDEEAIARQVEPVVRGFRKDVHFTLDEFGRNIALADEGIRVVEETFHCGNLFDPGNLELYTAVSDAVHAQHLLRRDVDYVVKNGAIESVDEFKGRIAQDRRWPAGLHTAIEAKEHVAFKRQGRVLGSMTLQNLVALYTKLSGMTGTAATQASEFQACYDLDVHVIPPHRPVIRQDDQDVMLATKAEKEAAVVAEIRRVHAAGQPVLVGTTSVEESESLSAKLAEVSHTVLNARNEEEEAAIVARAGERGAITISTNMAGRGVDIKLGDGVSGLGGLYVIGMNRHESRRIDNQLRGRAGRQGDPGRSRFFISLEDDLMVKYQIDAALGPKDVERVQRTAESHNLEIRKFLNEYEQVIEWQRQALQVRRQAVVESDLPELERIVTLTTMDDLWSDYLAKVAELRSSVVWYSQGNRQPLHEFLKYVDEAHQEMSAATEGEIERRLAAAEAGGTDPRQRGATWTYLTTDNPFGSETERVLRGIVRKFKKGGLWQ